MQIMPIFKAKTFSPRQLIFLIYFCCLPLSASSDTLYAKDGTSRRGVVLSSTDEKIVFATAKGRETFAVADVDRIDHDTEEKNTLLLAGQAREQGDSAKAYYLYEKILEKDPDSEEAVKGLRETEPSVSGNLGTKGGEVWVSDFRRYQSQPAGTTDREILAGDSDRTEDLLKEFGLILGTEDGRIKVQEVVAGSRADKGGLEINDFLTEIGGRPAGYMGQFDAVAFLMDKKDGPVSVGVEREVRYWISGEEQGFQTSMFDLAGISLAAGSGGFTVSRVNRDSDAFREGLRAGDTVISINGTRVKDIGSLKDAEQRIRDTVPGYMDLMITRRLTV